MTVILDPELKALMSEDQSVAVLWQDTKGQTALLAKAMDEDVESFKGSIPIQSYWELGRFACGSVFRFHLTIFDQPKQPYRFETFINVGSPEQRECVEQLLTQTTLDLHFFNSQTEYVFTKVIPIPSQQRQQLQKLIAQAVDDWKGLGDGWDFDQAKSLFLRGQSF